MTELNDDVLFYIFQDLYYLITTSDSNNEKKYEKSLYFCLFVNKHWCKIMVPILWSYPYKHVYKKESLLNIIISHLSDNSIKFLKDESIIKANFQKQKLSFNYVKFCRYLDDIHKIFPIRSSLLEEEIYKLFISECSSIKSLSSEMVYYPIYKYLGSNISLSNLSELCLVSRSNYNDFYHELAQICRSIEKIYIDLRCDLPEITELIEMQKQIKYIYVKEYGNCEKINQALEKHANSIVLLNLTIYTKNGSFLYDLLLPKLINLQYLRINNMESECILEHVIYLSYHNLQILDLVTVSLDIAINIIQNTNGNLWKIKIRRSDYDHIKEYDQTIHQYCPNIKYVSLFITDDETLKELENIFIKCQHLVAIDILNRISHEYVNKLLNLFVDSAPLTLYKFHIDFITTDFDRESLKLFFTNWNRKGRKTLHLYHICNSWHGNFVVKDIIELDYYDDDFWNHRITMLNDEKND
ncbi:hypothetical protein RhiirA1_465956 [Rhizophagus irregularis]|uniref:F-box domain-containing protein n=1 Tax=Rhizophagus irregularis TaxID=588596 RepID=A0A2N0REX2_9GLOM|nr:hypothetical protein RhiirA1_465956 [Rhizophagus irregularis]